MLAMSRTTEVRFVETRGLALTVLCIASYLAGLRLWRLAQGIPGKSEWIYPLNSWLPNWAAVILNIFTYGFFAGFFIYVIIRWKGLERIIFAILFGQGLISPLRQFLPSPMATTVVWVQAFAGAVMFLAALKLFLQLPKQRT